MSKKLSLPLVLLALILLNLVLTACSLDPPISMVRHDEEEVLFVLATGLISTTIPKIVGFPLKPSLSLSSNLLTQDKTMNVRGFNFPAGGEINLKVEPIYDAEVLVMSSGLSTRRYIVANNEGFFRHSFALRGGSLGGLFDGGLAVIQAYTNDYKVFVTAIVSVVLENKSLPTAISVDKPLLFFSGRIVAPDEKLTILGRKFPANTKLIIQITPEENDLPLWDRAKKFDKFKTDVNGNFNLEIIMSQAGSDSAFEIGKNRIHLTTADNKLTASFSVGFYVR